MCSESSSYMYDIHSCVAKTFKSSSRTARLQIAKLFSVLPSACFKLLFIKRDIRIAVQCIGFKKGHINIDSDCLKLLSIT